MIARLLSILLLLSSVVPASAQIIRGGSGGEQRTTISATDVGMTAGGFDNAPLVSTLMSAIAPLTGLSGAGRPGFNVVFPALPGQASTEYYFSGPLDITRQGVYECPSGPYQGAVSLVFAAGVDGVIADNNTLGPDGGVGFIDLRGCRVRSLGFGLSETTAGNATVSTSVQNVGTITNPGWTAGDGIIMFADGAFNWGQITGLGTITGGSGGTDGTYNNVQLTDNNRSVTDGNLATANITVTGGAVTAVTIVTRGNTYYAGDVLTAVSANSGNVTGFTVPVASVAGNGMSIVPPGAYIDSCSPCTGKASLTMHSGFEPTLTSTGGYSVGTWRLPAALADTANVTSGSNTVAITSGTTLFQVGNQIWANGFPFGATVKTASGAVGAQTLTIDGLTYNTDINSTVTATGESIWRLPSGFNRRQVSHSTKSWIEGFVFGLKCMCNGIWGAGMNGALDEGNTFFENVIGRFIDGNDTGASTSLMNVYSHNFLADIAEFGTVGSLYLGDNSNSAEAGTAMWPVIGYCSGTALTTYIGMYIGQNIPYQNAGRPYCMSVSGGFVPPTLGSAPSSSGQMFIGMQNGAPNNNMGITGIGKLWGKWEWNEGQSSSSPCFGLASGGDAHGNPIQNSEYHASNCGISGTRHTWSWNATNQMWEMQETASNLPEMGLTGRPSSIPGLGESYAGYAGKAGNNSYPTFPHGLMMQDSDHAAFAPANDRLITMYTSAPTDSWQKQGNITFNRAPSAGGVDAWVQTADGGTYRAAMPVANDTGGTDWTLGSIVRTGSSSNKDMAGRIALSSGTASYTLTATYASAPNCFCADTTTPANACSVSESTTTLTFTGTGTDTVKWVCFGRN